MNGIMHFYSLRKWLLLNFTPVRWCWHQEVKTVRSNFLTYQNLQWKKPTALYRYEIIAFVRTHPNLGVPVVQSHKFSKYQGRLPISRPHRFYQGHLGRETGLLSTRFPFRKWRTRIRNQWLPLVLTLFWDYNNGLNLLFYSTRDRIFC